MQPVRNALACLVLMSAVSNVCPSVLAQQPAPAPKEGVKGKIEAVTVYRGQALVTRLIDAGGAAGLREVVVTDLPANVVSSSLYAESAEGAEVRSVLYRERPVGEDVREEVRKLDAAIRTLQDAQRANARATQLAGERKQYLDRLEQFVAPTAQTELTKGVLNAETLQGLTNFQFAQRKQIADEELKLALEARDLAEQLSVQQRTRNELTGGSARVNREAVVFANFPGANAGKIRVRYLVASATWNPSYIVRAEKNAKSVTLEYNASIQQMSGEDWSDVQMTLSTATPSLVAMAPVLDPLGITLAAVAPQTPGRTDQLGYVGAKLQLRQKREEIDNQRSLGNNFNAAQATNALGGGSGGSFGGILNTQVNTLPGQPQAGQEDRQSFDRRLNEVSKEMQVLEILARDAKDKDSRSGGVAAEGVSVTYQLASRTSLPSRQDTQLIQIASKPMKAEFFKLATPVLTSYVYDGATVTNEGGMVLLAGPVASYDAGQFVGGGEIPTVAIGETFTAGFGIDSSLRAVRELIEKTEVVQGGNRVVTFNYKLGVENFGSTPASVRLMDRIPTTKDNDMKITPTPSSKELSADPVYQQNDRKKGLLRWDVEVPAQAIGAKAVAVDYQFKLEYDKQMTVTGLGAGK